MAFIGTPSATEVTQLQEFSRPVQSPLGFDYHHEGGIFGLTGTTPGKTTAYVIHPDWVSEVQQKTSGQPKLPPVMKPSKSVDIHQPGHFIIAPDWVSEARRLPSSYLGRSHRPWNYEFKDAGQWMEQLPARSPPRSHHARSSLWGRDNTMFRPSTGIHLVEHESGWMPVTSRQQPAAAASAPVTNPRDGPPTYAYGRFNSTSYADHFSRTAPGTYDIPMQTNRMDMPCRSYNSWNVYSNEMARSRREVPPRPSYMMPSASSWVP